ncbi:MAG: DNA polymerase IV [Nitrospira sp.]|nr:DNA polymerase IV [Nitrospira sp.]
MPRIIAHIDMDAFYAAIEERDTPAFRGRPLAVGADPAQGQGRGVVSTANYQAREYGIYSATPISTAWRLSEAARRKGLPPVIFVSVDMCKYARVSEAVMAIARRAIPVLEQASIDEAYGDLSGTGSFEAAAELCRSIKGAILAEERLTASVGIGPNKMIAKIASGVQKPDGFTVVTEAEAEAFLAPLSVRAIPGIGPKTESMLAAQQIRVVAELKRLSLADMDARFGKRGLEWYAKIRAQDDSPVEEHGEPKSISEQETFDEDTLDSQVLVERLSQLRDGVFARLAQEGFDACRTVAIIVRFADFTTVTRAHTFADPVQDGPAVRRELLKLLLPFFDRRENPRRQRIRLLGVRVEKLQ